MNKRSKSMHTELNSDSTTKAEETSVLRIKECLMEEVRQMNLLSDIFMSVALEDVNACQHVIRILTGILDLIVKEVRSQYRVSKITSHDAILDILAEDSKGRLHNLEIQRKDTIDHARRTRFYAAMMDSEYLLKGQSYSEMAELHIIYISETDIWKAGKTVYKVKKFFEDTDIVYEDGIHISYINAAVDDGSEIANLMKYFKTTDPLDMSQGDLSKRVHLLKCEEGGRDIMYKISEELYNEVREKGMEEGELRKAKQTALNMKKKGYSDTTIADLLEVGVNIIQQWFTGDSIAN